VAEFGGYSGCVGGRQVFPAWQQYSAGLWAFLAVIGSSLMAMVASLLGRLKLAQASPQTPAYRTDIAAKADAARISRITFDRLRSPRFTIAPPPSDFVGRQAELLALLENFDKGVLITSANGSAGMGTTALGRGWPLPWPTTTSMAAWKLTCAAHLPRWKNHWIRWRPAALAATLLPLRDAAGRSQRTQ
jgi:hypothetical protein